MMLMIIDAAAVVIIIIITITTIAGMLRSKITYSVSQKKSPPLRFSDIFSKRLGIFNQFFYTPITRSFVH